MYPAKISSLMLGAIAFVFAAFVMPSIKLFSESTLIVLAINAILILGIRWVAKWEDLASQLSIWMIIVSCALVAIFIEATLVRFIVGGFYIATLIAMRHFAKHEACLENGIIKPRI